MEGDVTSTSSDVPTADSLSKAEKRRKSALERQLETNMTEKMTSPLAAEVGCASRYGRARKLKRIDDQSWKTRSERSPSQKRRTPHKVSPARSPTVYRMNASKSPVKVIASTSQSSLSSIEHLLNQNKCLSRFADDVPESPEKPSKVYVRRDLIQNGEKTSDIMKHMFSPTKSPLKSPYNRSHLNAILQRSADEFLSNDSSRRLSNPRILLKKLSPRWTDEDKSRDRRTPRKVEFVKQNLSPRQVGLIENPSVVKSLSFNNEQPETVQVTPVETVPQPAPLPLDPEYEKLERGCRFQASDVAWARVGTYPYWPCLITREPSSGKIIKLIGSGGRGHVHVSYLADNGRRGWVSENMIRPFYGRKEFESARDAFTAEQKKKDPKLYAAFITSGKLETKWNLAAEEGEALLAQPSYARIDMLYEIVYKPQQKTNKSPNKIRNTVPIEKRNMSLSESLLDTLFSENTNKVEDKDRSRSNLDVSDVVTACLDDMATKTGNIKIQKQSHMDRWLQKAKSKTPEKAIDNVKTATAESRRNRKKKRDIPSDDSDASQSAKKFKKRTKSHSNYFLRTDSSSGVDSEESKGISLDEVHSRITEQPVETIQKEPLRADSPSVAESIEKEVFPLLIGENNKKIVDKSTLPSNKTETLNKSNDFGASTMRSNHSYTKTSGTLISQEFPIEIEDNAMEFDALIAENSSAVAKMADRGIVQSDMKCSNSNDELNMTLRIDEDSSNDLCDSTRDRDELDDKQQHETAEFERIFEEKHRECINKNSNDREVTLEDKDRSLEEEVEFEDKYIDGDSVSSIEKNAQSDSTANNCSDEPMYIAIITENSLSNDNTNISEDGRQSYEDSKFGKSENDLIDATNERVKSTNKKVESASDIVESENELINLIHQGIKSKNEVVESDKEEAEATEKWDESVIEIFKPANIEVESKNEILESTDISLSNDNTYIDEDDRKTNEKCDVDEADNKVVNTASERVKSTNERVKSTNERVELTNKEVESVINKVDPDNNEVESENNELESDNNVIGSVINEGEAENKVIESTNEIVELAEKQLESDLVVSTSKTNEVIEILNSEVESVNDIVESANGDKMENFLDNSSERSLKIVDSEKYERLVMTKEEKRVQEEKRRDHEIKQATIQNTETVIINNVSSVFCSNYENTVKICSENYSLKSNFGSIESSEAEVKNEKRNALTMKCEIDEFEPKEMLQPISVTIPIPKITNIAPTEQEISTSDGSETVTNSTTQVKNEMSHNTDLRKPSLKEISEIGNYSATKHCDNNLEKEKKPTETKTFDIAPKIVESAQKIHCPDSESIGESDSSNTENSSEKKTNCSLQHTFESLSAVQTENKPIAQPNEENKIEPSNSSLIAYIKSKRYEFVRQNPNFTKEEILSSLCAMWIRDNKNALGATQIRSEEVCNTKNTKEINIAPKEPNAVPQKVSQTLDSEENHDKIETINDFESEENPDSSFIRGTPSTEASESDKIDTDDTQQSIESLNHAESSSLNKPNKPEDLNALTSSKSKPREDDDYIPVEESQNNTSIESDSSSTADDSHNKKQHTTFNTSKYEDPSFLNYVETKQSILMDQNPNLTQEEALSYLYDTWPFSKQNDKDDALVKGLGEAAVEPRRKYKKKSKPKEYTCTEFIVSKEKPVRKRATKTSYFENDTESDSEYANSQTDQIQDKNGQPKLNEVAPSCETGDSGQFLDIENTDEDWFIAELLKPQPNLFKGLSRERLCEICDLPGNIVQCKGRCGGMYHVDCVRRQAEPAPVLTRKKKKKQGRPRKFADSDQSSDNSKMNGGDSDCTSDDKSQENISMDETMGHKTIIIDDVVDFESQFDDKMKEALEKALEIDIDLYSTDEELDWQDTPPGQCEIFEIKPRLRTERKIDDMLSFKCNDCQKYNQSLCFVCKSILSPKQKTDVTQRCSLIHCYKVYHLECLNSWPQTQFSPGGLDKESEAITCPRHVCHTCVCDDPRGCKTRFSGDKLARCVRCPAVYHSFTKCLPAGSKILNASHIICPRHYEQKPGKAPYHVNTSWCFICATGGTLICCEYCPMSFHADCLNIEPPEDGYMCEDCETGRLPLYGEMVWAKLGNYRWWPGVTLHPRLVPDNVHLLRHSTGEFVVRFFGGNDHFWLYRGRVFPYQEGDTGNVSSQKSKIDTEFVMAVEQAQRAYKLLKEAKVNEEETSDIASSLLPPHYVKLRVNKPHGSLAGRRVELDEESSSTQCDCRPEDDDPCSAYTQCLNRVLLTECGPTCRAGDRCNNRSFEKRLYPKLAPRRTPQRGWGLHTLQDIKKGQFVIEYVGELLDDGEFRRRMQRMHDTRDENYYFLTLDKDRMIDAGPKGNAARFMNHSCEPNCETQKWTVLGDVRVGLFAIRDIPANSEVTFNYNLECAGVDKKKCMCGAKRCAGYIGAKPKQEEPQPKKPKRKYKKKPRVESPSTSAAKPPPVRKYRSSNTSLNASLKSRELSEIEQDLLIIQNATKDLQTSPEEDMSTKEKEPEDSQEEKLDEPANEPLVMKLDEPAEAPIVRKPDEPTDAPIVTELVEPADEPMVNGHNDEKNSEDEEMRKGVEYDHVANKMMEGEAWKKKAIVEVEKIQLLPKKTNVDEPKKRTRNDNEKQKKRTNHEKAKKRTEEDGKTKKRSSEDDKAKKKLTNGHETSKKKATNDEETLKQTENDKSTANEIEAPMTNGEETSKNVETNVMPSNKILRVAMERCKLMSESKVNEKATKRKRVSFSSEETVISYESSDEKRQKLTVQKTTYEGAFFEFLKKDTGQDAVPKNEERRLSK